MFAKSALALRALFVASLLGSVVACSFEPTADEEEKGSSSALHSGADSGTPSHDGGAVSHDGGTPHADGGPAHTDGGVPATDAGPYDSDAGVDGDDDDDSWGEDGGISSGNDAGE